MMPASEIVTSLAVLCAETLTERDRQTLANQQLGQAVAELRGERDSLAEQLRVSEGLHAAVKDAYSELLGAVCNVDLSVPDRDLREQMATLTKWVGEIVDREPDPEDAE